MVRGASRGVVTEHQELTAADQVPGAWSEWVRGRPWSDDTVTIRRRKGPIELGEVLAWVSVTGGVPIAQFVRVVDLRDEADLKRAIFDTVWPSIIETRYSLEMERVNESAWRVRVQKHRIAISSVLPLRILHLAIEPVQRASVKNTARLVRDGSLAKRAGEMRACTK
jgi:hypothetical protein